VDFRILGPLEVLDQTGRSLPLGGAKQRALLAILLINANEVVSADRLIDDIWGNDPPTTASNALQVYMSQLRKVLAVDGPPAVTGMIVTRAPGYVLEVAMGDLDLSRFEDLVARGREALMTDEPAQASVLLRSALAIWRGHAFADFTYEPFAQTPIEKLEEMRMLALEDRVEVDLVLGRHAQVIPELEASLAGDVFRERVREHLMLALYRVGRQADALQTYQDGMKVLGDKLGIDPGPALQRLHEAILRHDPSLELPVAKRPVEVPSAFNTDVREDLRSAEQPSTAEVFQPATRDQVLPVTALFADIVGSTSLAERLSPEEGRAVIGECVNRMTVVVENFDGMIQASMGDGICAYFGVPVAHEDDIERVARCALRIRRVVEEFAREIEAAWDIAGFAVRIGINTDRTIVGLVGSGSPQEMAFGDSMNVAARLESSAEPGTILIGEAVAKRLTRGFVVKPRGKLKLKGRKGSVQASELLALISSSEPMPSTPLVGRERELERGRMALGNLEAGRGQVLLLQGDSGIGKTRLLAELRSAAGEGVTWLEGRCRSYGGDLPSWPFVELLRGWLGLSEGDTAMVVRMKLRSQLDELLGERSSDVFALLGRLLAVNTDSTLGEAVESIAPADLAERMRDAYLTWVAGLAAKGPVVLAIEDVHEADGSTRALAESLLSITDEAPLLLAFTLRPIARSEGWTLSNRVRADFRHRTTDLQIEPLSEEEAGFLVETLAPTGTLDPATKADIVAHAAGNPLFLEELLRVLVESGGLERRQGWTLTATSSAMLLPPAIESLLVSRIQHLPPLALDLTQAAAAIGQEVLAVILDDVAGAIEVRAGLGILLRSEILHERRRYPELAYAFRHPLLRDAALSTLTPARLRELYGRVGAAFEARDPEPSGERLVRLAYSFYRSDERTKALKYLELAAKRAIELHATEDAAGLLRRAAKVANEIGDQPAGMRASELLAGLERSRA
jgi:class 3 adenylate cyclase/DNA-binding SARP family transcriptional activator